MSSTGIKAAVRNRVIYPLARRLGAWIRESEFQPVPPAPFDNNYAWLRYAFSQLMDDPVCRRKAEYAWGVVQGAALARALGYPAMSALEFGVAGGNGLLALERISMLTQKMTGVRIEVVGFDSGAGLSPPQDYRDQPNMWFAGQLTHDPQEVRNKLTTAELRVGWVEETVHAWIAERHAPVGFVSFDLDLYSATKDAFTVLRADYEKILPRVPCYMDDIMGQSYSEFAGVRLAIAEFNEQPKRKLAPIYGLHHYVPDTHRSGTWERMYWCHLLEHPKYNQLDSITKAIKTDDEGRDIRVDVRELAAP